MRNYYVSKYILIPLLLCFSLFAHAENTFSKVYIFGDSLSDTGNLGSVIGGLPLPYFNNRVSNGPVAVETLATKLGYTAEASLHLLGLNAGTNYAVASARASGTENLDLKVQILGFQANHANIAPADALYVIFIGGNDVLDATHTPDITAAKAIVQLAVDEVASAINTLSLIGARSFLLINAPDVSKLPETRLIATATNNPDLIKRAKKLSLLFKNKLHKTLEEIKEQSEVNITEFNLFKFFNKVIKKASKLGFTNSTDACFSSILQDFHPDCNYGLNADEFIFFDEIHPTARVHAMAGEAFYKALNSDESDEEENTEE